MLTLGKAVLAGLVAGMSLHGAAQAQVLYRVGPPVVVASDLDGPYDGPPPVAYGSPPAVYGPPPVESRSVYGPALPVQEVYRILRNNGFSPLGAPQNRGNVITISVLDEDGEDGRLVIDAYTGRILRFVPAYTQGSRFSPATPVAYGPPPATIPARPAVPLPKPRMTASLPEKTGTITGQSPKIPPAPPAAIAAAAQPAPALPQAAPKPAVTIQPTQAMPPVLGAE